MCTITMYPFCLYPLVAEAEIEDEVDIHISDERESEECDEGSQEQEDRAEEEREENERLRPLVSLWYLVRGPSKMVCTQGPKFGATPLVMGERWDISV